MPPKESLFPVYEFAFIGGAFNTYTFQTVAGIVYAVTFTPTPYLFGEHSSFSKSTVELSLVVTDNPLDSLPPFDRQTARTLASIFEDFYLRNDDTITLYICASHDGRQQLRQQLFHRWFDYFERDDFVKIDDTIRDSSGIRYPVSLIIKRHNPFRVQLFEAFMQVTSGYNTGKD